MITIFQVFFEEIIFRGLLLFLLRDAPQTIQILVSAAIFSCFHALNAWKQPLKRTAQQICAAFASGLLLAFVTLQCGSILPAICIHILINLAAAFRLIPAPLYIDPGTGFMLFTVLTGLISAGVYSVKVFALKLKSGLLKKVETSEAALPLVIYSEDKRYWNIFEPICKELEKKSQDVTYITASEDDPVFSSPLGNIHAKYIEPKKIFPELNNLHANVVLATTPGLDVYQWKRSPGVKEYIHIPHAASDVTLYRMFGLDYYDDIILSGEYQAEDIRALEALRGLPPKNLVIIGVPYLDAMIERISETPRPDIKEPTILLAPSWGPNAIFSRYQGTIIEELLKCRMHIIIRPHPQSFISEKEMIDNLIEQYPPSEQIEWNQDADNFEVLRKSDILISDFSGIIFEFALAFDKPVIYTDPDLDLSPYDAWWLKKTTWTENALPRLGMCLTKDNIENLSTMVSKCISSKDFNDGRAQLKKETWAYPGQGAKRAADYLISRLCKLCEEDAA